MDFVPLVVMTAIVKKIVDVAKYVANADYNAVVTQLVGWLAGAFTVWMAAEADFTKNLQINGVSLDSLNAWSILMAGFAMASTAGLGWDTLKAIDGSNSAAVPHLLAKLRAGRTTEPAHTQESTPA